MSCNNCLQAQLSSIAHGIQLRKSALALKVMISGGWQYLHRCQKKSPPPFSIHCAPSLQFILSSLLDDWLQKSLKKNLLSQTLRTATMGIWWCGFKKKEKGFFFIPYPTPSLILLVLSCRSETNPFNVIPRKRNCRACSYPASCLILYWILLSHLL